MSCRDHASSYNKQPLSRSICVAARCCSLSLCRSNSAAGEQLACCITTTVSAPAVPATAVHRGVGTQNLLRENASGWVGRREKWKQLAAKHMLAYYAWRSGLGDHCITQICMSSSAGPGIRSESNEVCHLVFGNVPIWRMYGRSLAHVN